MKKDDYATIAARIDKALVNIYRAKEDGFKYFDFRKEISQLIGLYISDRNPKLKEKLLQYYSVFNDLNRESETTCLRLVNIDSEYFFFDVYRESAQLSEKILVNKSRYRKDSNLGLIITKYNLSIDDDLPFPLKKIYYFLEGSRNNFGKNLESPYRWINTLFTNISKEYLRINLNIIQGNLKISFEDYIESILIEKRNEDKRLKVKVIALIYRYAFETSEIKDGISNENKDVIAASYGYNSKTSGSGLKQDFDEYAAKGNRLKTGNDKKEANRKLQYLAQAIDNLEDYPMAKKLAIDEFILLKNKTENL